VAGYLDWLMMADWTDYYREYGLLVNALQAAVPGKRLVLKMPDHMPHLNLLLKYIPDAQIIQLHRDPETCILSLSSLLYSAHWLFTEELRPSRILETNTKLIEYYLAGNERLRQDPVINQAVLDVEFNDFITGPVDGVLNLYQKLGLPVQNDLVSELEQCESRGFRREHHYSLSQFD
jgi:hypothetical protein